MILHFSGHGFQNNKDFYLIKTNNKTIKKISDYNTRVNELIKNRRSTLGKQIKSGDILIFEDRGATLHMYQHDIVNLLSTYRSCIEPYIVVLNCCHSERVAEDFKQFGCSHVICCKADLELNDEGCIEFSKRFYNHLFSTSTKDNINVCAAFKEAIEGVEEKVGKTEAEKYQMLVLDSEERINMD